jgi:hypothetical protein
MNERRAWFCPAFSPRYGTLLTARIKPMYLSLIQGSQMKAFFLALPALALAGYVSAAQPTYKRDIPADLATQAKISEVTAVSTALGTVPNGTVTSVGLEQKHKRLFYSVDIQSPARSGVEEVRVNANTGKVMKHHHESAKTEAKESAAEMSNTGSQSTK